MKSRPMITVLVTVLAAISMVLVYFPLIEPARAEDASDAQPG